MRALATAIFLSMSCICLAAPSAAQTDDYWHVMLFNVDDSARIECAGQVVGTATFGSTADVRLPPICRTGKGVAFTVKFFNAGGPWDVGYRIMHRDEVLFTFSCGSSSEGCAGNDQRTGLVYSRDFAF